MKYLIPIYSTILLFAIVGCDDFLDVDNQNRTAIESIEDVQGLMNANFSSSFIKRSSVTNIMADDFQSREEKYLGFSDFELHVLSGITWEDQIYKPNEADEIWNERYNVIFLCNSGLIQLASIEPETETGRTLHNEVTGEAFAQRAFSYILLINDYAKHYDAATASSDIGVPIKTSINLEESIRRSTVAEVYDVILDNLNGALDLLPPMVDGFPSRNFRPGQNSVYAALAKVHLLREEWEEARQAAENSLSIYNALYDYSLLEERDDYPQWTYEDIEVIWDINGTWQGNSFIGGRRNDLLPQITEEMFSLYDTLSDLRWKLFFTVEDDEIIYSRAESGGGRQSLTWGITVPEVIVTLAEAQARLGNISEAMNTINQLREKRYDPESYVPATAGTMQEALEIILAERRKELLFTGARWIDQRRLIHLGEYNKTITRTYDGKTVSLEPSSPKYTLLIPSQVIALNPDLEQNPR